MPIYTNLSVSKPKQEEQSNNFWFNYGTLVVTVTAVLVHYFFM
ncbi:hypothetical protein [Pontibacillus litoralis]|uniref:Uncharacterized protein n=1 Tax=Pontibacillus litoralis JSM 072002 TaxID=1385512 RepID=A0A0A5HUV5_9BACI|nr:hypothetical protein [Pontibacillus litoralis]KGX87412.1 hypothetical protein N784_15960 [Pontibacillus litoralis JSM 072002]